jgi:NAD(P)-dependent dehydrogenase (short-subunit alcohol dehydrogenase family)
MIMLEGHPFNGKTVVITGAGSGLGQELSLTLSRYGASIIGIGRTEDKLLETQKLVKEAGGEFSYGAMDIRDFSKVSLWINQLFSSFNINCLVNNAAGNFIARTEDLSINAFRSVIDIVLLGSINMTLEIGKRWIERQMKGNIVNILTTYADTGSGYVTPSAAAKGGLRSFTRSIAVEWGPRGIRTNGIAPGPFKTKGAWDNLLPDNSVEELLRSKNPMKRLGTFNDITELCSYLLSDYSSYINGDVITIDGGEWLQGAGQFNMLSSLDNETWEKMRERRKVNK